MELTKIEKDGMINTFHEFATNFFKDGFVKGGGKAPTIILSLIINPDKKPGIGVIAMPGLSMVKNDEMETITKKNNSTH